MMKLTFLGLDYEVDIDYRKRTTMLTIIKVETQEIIYNEPLIIGDDEWLSYIVLSIMIKLELEEKEEM